jgi:1,4-alpha-glucan branching enzyme
MVRAIVKKKIGKVVSKVIRAKPTTFKLFAPQARKVCLAGSFNNWNTDLLTAKKDVRGNWQVKISLKPGKYEYKFFVDGSWLNDPSCTSYAPNGFGTQNCIIDIK